MKCTFCDSEDVPCVGGTYASKMAIPLNPKGNDFNPETDIVRVAFPIDRPFCKKCRKDILRGEPK